MKFLLGAGPITHVSITFNLHIMQKMNARDSESQVSIGQLTQLENARAKISMSAF